MIDLENNSMTEAEKDAISSPTDGLVIYQTDGAVGLYLRKSGAWIMLSESQNLSVSATVDEKIILNKINLTFEVKESEKFIVEKINIYGNNITRENVIRNQLEIDEGDYFNKILTNKSINNIKSLNFFKLVKHQVVDGSGGNTKIINIEVDEKATGEISAGAGVGTSGGTITFGVKENNYLGKGLSVDSNLTIESDAIKGILSLTDPNYKNSDKLLFGSIQADENDQLASFGYKSTKTGFRPSKPITSVVAI